jgi:hypothetical protein
LVDYCIRTAHEDYPADWALEVEAEFAYEFDRFILIGHSDLFGVAPDASEFAGSDWKLGHEPVDPAEVNNQVLGYLVLGKRAYPQAKRGTYRIVQPRNCPEDGNERVTEVTLSGEELEKCAAYLEAEVNKALDNAYELNSGMKQCRWCPVAQSMQCPALRAELEFMKLTLTPQMVAKLKDGVTDADLGDVVIVGRTISRALESAEDELKERVSQKARVVAGCGVSITQKVEGGRYDVKEPVMMYDAVRAMLPPTRLANVVSYSTTRLRDELAAELQVPKSGKAAVTAETVFQAKFAPFLEQGKRHRLIFT